MRKTLTKIIILASIVRGHSQNCNALCNGSFDTPSLQISVSLTQAINCWNTTASDGMMEIWASGFQGVNSYDGPHHMELNATEAATMYQDFNLSITGSVPVSFAHRGRAGMDSMEVFIGPLGGPYISLGKFGDGASAWGTYTVSYNVLATGMHRISFTPIYWTGGNIALGNFLDAVSVGSAGSLLITTNTTNVCPGDGVLLSASGATSYAWTGGPQTSTWQVQPFTTTVYTVSGSTSGSCSGVGMVTVQVKPGPQLTVTSSPSVVCKNAAPPLISAQGALTYQWSGGAATNTITGSSAGTAAYYVTGTNSLGCKATASISVVVLLCAGIDEADKRIFMLHPNPANGPLTISLARAGQLTLLNSAGRVCMKVFVEPGAVQFDTEDLSAGVYTLVFENHVISENRRIIITK
jgi:hypothetical protein